MVARQQKEDERRERKSWESTDKNGAAKRGQTSDKEKKKVDFVATAGVVLRPLFQQKQTLSLQVSTRRDLINCEAFNASLSTSNVCAPPYLECVSHYF